MNEDFKDWLAICSLDELEQWKRYIEQLVMLKHVEIKIVKDSKS